MRPIVLAMPLLLLLPVGAVRAQAPGSYQQSCTDIRQSGGTLMARCRKPSGNYAETSIDIGRCRGVGVSNTNGRLTCGGAAGSLGPDRGGDDDRGFGGGRPPPRQFNRGYDDQFGYGEPPPFRRGPPPPPPPPRYYGDNYDPYAPPRPPRPPRYDPDDADY